MRGVSTGNQGFLKDMAAMVHHGAAQVLVQIDHLPFSEEVPPCSLRPSTYSLALRANYPT